MNKEQALHAFWSSFGLTAYDESSVPSGSSFPRITYNVATDNLNHSVSLNASIWYRSSSWSDITTKCNQIAESIGIGGKVIRYTGGAAWIKRGSPFSQRVQDEDDMIRHISLNVEVEFLSAY